MKTARENHRGLIAAPAAMLDLATDSRVATSNDVVYISQQMAIIPLTLSHGLNAEQIFQIAKALGLEKQSRIEVWQCWDMVQIWQHWTEENFGEVKAVRHRSPPDDPPDLELVFEGRAIGMEHTRLQPKHLGQADALMRKSGEGGFIPSISSPPADFAELRSIISGVQTPWSSTVDDWKAIVDLLAIALRKKMGGMPDGGIIGMIHDLVVASANQRILAEVAQNIVNRDEFADFTSYSLILLDRANHLQFHSSLVRRGEDIREQMQ